MFDVKQQLSLLTILLVATATTALAGGPYFPTSTFTGVGNCKTASGFGQAYDADLKFTGWSITRSERPRGSKEGAVRIDLSTQDRGYGIFEVSAEGKKIGDGYCGRPCQLDIERDHAREMWTLNFTNEEKHHLQLTRALFLPKGLVVCEEDLV